MWADMRIFLDGLARWTKIHYHPIYLDYLDFQY